jgi:cation diffusion facilitator family transporter
MTPARRVCLPAMHAHDLTPFAHSHSFESAGAGARERAMLRVTWLTLAAMALELAAGWWSGSLALLADGWHMGTHALAIGGAALAYKLARRASAREGSVGFGGWKIEVLFAYTSALALFAVAIALVVDGVQRLLEPRPIAYAEAIGVAVLGLLVNVLSAWWLMRAAPQAHHGHDHSPGQNHADGHARDHGRGAHDHDHNYAAAYAHVLADALTSLLAIGALGGGLLFGWAWLDPAAALVGAALIARWAWIVVRAAAASLVDARGEPALARRVRQAVESDGDAKVADLHVWQVGSTAWATALTVVADRPNSALDYRRRVEALTGIAHVTVEVHRCAGSAVPHVQPHEA